MSPSSKKDSGIPAGFEEVEASFFKFDKVGDSIQGVLESRDFALIDGRDVPRFTLVTDGGMVQFLAPKLLEQRVDLVQDGEEIIIHYIGNVKTKDGKQTMRDFKVYRKTVS